MDGSRVGVSEKEVPAFEHVRVQLLVKCVLQCQDVQQLKVTLTLLNSFKPQPRQHW